MPTAYDPATKILYVPIMEACMDLVPVPEGERGSLSTGVRWTVRPRPESDGKYGRLQALNVETGKTVWVERQRAPLTTGTLVTAGGARVCRLARPDVQRVRRRHRRAALEDAPERRAERSADQLFRQRAGVRRRDRRPRRLSVDQLRRCWCRRFRIHRTTAPPSGSSRCRPGRPPRPRASWTRARPPLLACRPAPARSSRGLRRFHRSAGTAGRQVLA